MHTGYMKKFIAVMLALAAMCCAGCSKGQTGGGNNAVDVRAAACICTRPVRGRDKKTPIGCGMY